MWYAGARSLYPHPTHTMNAIQNTATVAENTPDKSGIAGHPAGLTTLFFTELWERFSYYGMRAILILYMTATVAEGGLGFPTARAAGIYGAYTASVYMMSVPGGWIADRFLGARLAVLVGGVVIALGHFSMAFPTLSSFYLGLILIVLGTGLLKPNVSSMVGSLYGPTDRRRDSGFSIFYMGINLGATIAPFVCGFLAQDPRFKTVLQGFHIDPQSSWHWGFAAAGIGMTLGLVQYLLHRRRLEHVGNLPERRVASKAPAEPLTRTEINRLIVIGILFVFSSLFWMAFEQAGSSLNLFAKSLTRNSIFGFEFPSSWLQAAGPIDVILLSPVFAWIWFKLGRRDPSGPAKFATGLAFSALGFGVIAYAASQTGGGRVSPLWLMVVYLLLTFGELCLSPVGLSLVTKLAPARLVGSMMGVWFLSISLGNYAGGWVAGLFNASDETALVQLFGKVGLVTLSACLILIFLRRPILRLMGSVK
jgi:POT family proton-dependent oligopeptide transporter